MQLQLSGPEAEMLRDLFHDYLPALRLETARTEAREMRHLMVQRQELVERILAELDRTAL